jgi:hypothetical protein
MLGEIQLSNVSPRAAPDASNRTRLRLKAWWSQIVRAWFSIQLTSYGGKYSIERMLAHGEYILVIFATPVRHLLRHRFVYLATCMQSVRSVETVLLIVAVDVIGTAIVLRELHRRTQQIGRNFNI